MRVVSSTVTVTHDLSHGGLPAECSYVEVSPNKGVGIEKLYKTNQDDLTTKDSKYEGIPCASDPPMYNMFIPTDESLPTDQSSAAGTHVSAGHGINQSERTRAQRSPVGRLSCRTS